MNPILITETIQINYPNINVDNYRWLVSELNNIDKAIEDRLFDLDLNNNSSIITDCFCYHYVNKIEECYWFALHINNQLKYNYYINKIVELHKKNIYDFYNKENNESFQKEKKNNNIKQYKSKNKYIKNIFRDVLTGEIKYEYYNDKTKDKIISNNPDLLEELNTKKRKKNNIKTKVVNMNNIYINFSNFKRNK